MSNVKIVCEINVFDAHGRFYTQDEEKMILRSAFNIDNLAFELNEQLNFHNTNDVILIGDNKEYLKGIREQLLTDCSTEYSNKNLNISILGE